MAHLVEKVEVTVQEANAIFAALGELPGKVGFEAMYILRLKFDTATLEQAPAPAPAQNNEKPKP